MVEKNSSHKVNNLPNQLYFQSLADLSENSPCDLPDIRNLGSPINYCLLLMDVKIFFSRSFV